MWANTPTRTQKERNDNANQITCPFFWENKYPSQSIGPISHVIFDAKKNETITKQMNWFEGAYFPGRVPSDESWCDKTDHRYVDPLIGSYWSLPWTGGFTLTVRLQVDGYLVNTTTLAVIGGREDCRGGLMLFLKKGPNSRPQIGIGMHWSAGAKQAVAKNRECMTECQNWCDVTKCIPQVTNTGEHRFVLSNTMERRIINVIDFVFKPIGEVD